MSIESLGAPVGGLTDRALRFRIAGRDGWDLAAADYGVSAAITYSSS